MAHQDDDFAALFEASAPRKAAQVARRIKVGEAVEGVVVAVGRDFVFVDVGAKSEARISRDQVSDREGKVTVAVGDRLRARVASAGRAGIELVTALGRHGGVDLAAIEIAAASGAPIEGTFTKAVKGGLEVEIGGIRGFCPASQVDVTYVKDLEALVDQRVSFKVVEIRDGGRSVIVSRKAVLADERAERARALRDHLQIGAELDGTVTAVQPYGAFVDLGGMEGLVHISELGSGRVDKVEDVVRVGETVKVRIVSIEPRGGNPDDLKISLSMRLQDAAAASAGGGEVSGGGGEAISADEVLDGTVAHVASYGVFVDTPKGRGLVPLRELGLAPGADPKRSFPAGKEVKVVLLSRDEANNRLRFSISGVARAEERSNYRDFAKGSSGGKSGKPSGSSSGLGSLGDLLRDKIPEIPAGGGKGARKRR
ncbi:MAG: S1 RNA-binding domain-containing protein [Myxococcales bacterium]|nr:S1 RNA-binding domain-containing protein [Myxococcales bacterium]